jgi:hypothetical protein
LAPHLTCNNKKLVFHEWVNVRILTEFTVKFSFQPCFKLYYLLENEKKIIYVCTLILSTLLLFWTYTSNLDNITVFSVSNSVWFLPQLNRKYKHRMVEGLVRLKATCVLFILFVALRLMDGTSSIDYVINIGWSIVHVWYIT